MRMLLALVRRLVALAATVVIGFAMYQYGISDINSEALWKDKAEAPLLALQSDTHRLSSDALVVSAQALSEESPERSEALAMAALRQNPSSGRAATHLLSLYEAQGKGEQADQVAELASRLWPAHSYTRSNLAEYWLRRGRADKVIEEWNVLLTRGGGTASRQFFAPMQGMLETAEYAPLILQYIDTPPRWWNGFFSHLSRNLDLARLVQLYRLRVASSEPPSKSEQNSYIRRLMKERLWQEANDTWFLSLSPRQMRFSGLLYDGGFESDVFNQGFGWQLSRAKNPRIKPDITYGIKGRKALQVTLRKQDPINFRHVSQRIMLEAGSYELSLRYRTDTLKTTKGLSWRIRCIEGGKQVLAESIPLLGSNPWTSTKVAFEVPASCPVQLLRLEATSRFRHDHFFQGNAWFDDIRIDRVESATQEAR